MGVLDPVSAAKPTKPRGDGLRWQPGQSGNPAGRPKGSRNRLAESVIEALTRDFEAHGVAAIEAVRVNDPAAYLRTIAQLVPKQVGFEDGGREQLQIVIRHIGEDDDPG